MVTAATNTSEQHSKYLAAVVFNADCFSELNGKKQLNKNVSYKLRFSYSPVVQPKGRQHGFAADTTWSTRFMFPLYQVVGPRQRIHSCSGNPGNCVIFYFFNFSFFSCEFSPLTKDNHIEMQFLVVRKSLNDS